MNAGFNRELPPTWGQNTVSFPLKALEHQICFFSDDLLNNGSLPWVAALSLNVERLGAHWSHRTLRLFYHPVIWKIEYLGFLFSTASLKELDRDLRLKQHWLKT